MSKFFNESRNVQGASAAPATAKMDIQELVGSIKQSLSNTTAVVADNNLNHLLNPLQHTRDAAMNVLSGRLENCRSIRLPRNEEKSFLVTQYNPAMQAAVEAYRTLRTRLAKQQTKSGTRSLVISSAMQGEGKSLTALNLALCYAQIQNWPVLLVDADLRSRGLTRLMGDPESLGLAAVLEGSCNAQSSVLRTDIPGLHVVPAGETSISPAELFSTANWREFVSWASETFRLVIVDSPPLLNLADFELIMTPCESALLVVRARKTARESLARMLAQVDSRKLAGVVFNGTEEVADHSYYHQTTTSANS